MTGPMLDRVAISNFRSIRGDITAQLDANMVLIHGENGAGKTSLLSAIEVALTGRVLSLQRADPHYESQLLHRGETRDIAPEGRVTLSTTGLDGENEFEAIFSTTGLGDGKYLSGSDASFFSERCYLPQSMLGQLLQIYQDSDSSSASPLSRFVNDLLRLDRLDAIETGLTPVGDVRNLRKTTEKFVITESEKSRLERELAQHQQDRSTAATALATALGDLNAARAKFGYSQPVTEQLLAGIPSELETEPDEAELTLVHDARRRLDSLRREATQQSQTAAGKNEAELRVVHQGASEALEAWRAAHVSRLREARESLALLVPEFNGSLADPARYYGEAFEQVRVKVSQAQQRSLQADKDIVRRAALEEEIAVARASLARIEGEIGRISSNSGSLASALAEIAQFITGDGCPVCERNFLETDQGPLSDHVNHRIRSLSSASERLLGLSRAQVDARSSVERLEVESAALDARGNNAESAANLSRVHVDLQKLAGELEWSTGVVVPGAQLAAAEAAAKRALEQIQVLDAAGPRMLVEARELAATLKITAPVSDDANELLEWLWSKIEETRSTLEARILARRQANDALAQCSTALQRRTASDGSISAISKQLDAFTAAMDRALKVRTQAQTIRGQVEHVRSKIIRRVFNERLNKLWRDLFVRLTPNEPFTPAFSIPSNSTHRLQPKLVTLHRSGGEGGTPGAMLSAGNLNTAALTLFTALHLTVKPRLPWLILDDPIQSMDDVHISQFAALLRTLSKEHGRQILVAVHDRQLFEYLRLELSPAFPDDSMLTLELTRGASRDTLCIPKRYTFKPETALRAA